MAPEPALPASNRGQRGHKKKRSLSDSISLVGSYTIGWAAPTEQVRFLVVSGDAVRWVGFRDGFMSKWTNLNIVCGLIMGAISTVMFADVELDEVAFGFGVVSLLSSLIAIGFGTGLMYVLGDVAGETLHTIGKRYPLLFVFALSIPQVWAGISIVSFFLCTGIFAWTASDKGWTAKAGILLSAGLTVAHLIAFAILFHKQHTVESMIDHETDGGMKHNLHLEEFTRRGGILDSDSSQDSKPQAGRPGAVPFDKQYGGSGAGHFVNSPPTSMPRVTSHPIVESPDPTQQEFGMRVNRGAAGSAYVQARSGSSSGSGWRGDGEPEQLFPRSEGKRSK